jgi:NADP-dependent 3-hydroxy acid dehydrogenase YdfG/phosphoribosyl 1,2-cyclic phosphodiesterase
MSFTTTVDQITDDLTRVRFLMANCYLQGTRDQWVLIDAGLPGSAKAIRRAATQRFGDVPPRAIILTHGHFDHVGALPEILEEWDVPVYAHPTEIPHLTGRVDYPPPDPTVGEGAMAVLSFLYPKRAIDLGDRVRPLPADGRVPEMPGWRWIHTPGHSDGHVSLFRDADRCLIAGDAFLTVKQESLLAVARQRQELHGPPAYFTPDWAGAKQSVATLAVLRPLIAATGHGTPMRRKDLTARLNRLAVRFDQVAVPRHGRYVPKPKETRLTVNLKPIDQQVIVITGASSGIGLATARLAAEQGATVLLAARTEGALKEAVDDIAASGGKASYVVADVGDRDHVERIAATAKARHGGFDTWVNDAGVSIFGRIDEITDEDNRRLFDTNFWGVVYGSQVAAEHLKGRGGAIINLGSVASDVALPMQGMYSASKHAVKGFTDAFRTELEAASEPISVTLIKPASINSTFTMNARKYSNEDVKLPPPVYDPREVANAIVHAASHPQRDIYIGGGGKMMSGFARQFPRLMDRVSERAMIGLEFRDRPVRNPEGNLWRGQGRNETDGDHPGMVMRPSIYTRASLHPIASRVLIGTGGVAAALGVRRLLERMVR